MNPWSVALGAIVTGVLAYRVVPWLVEYIDDEVRTQFSDSGRIRPRTRGGQVLGCLECAIYFGSLLYAGGAALVAAWLVFKTATKWKTWDSTTGISHAEIQVTFRVFLIGTAANIVAALVGVAVAQLP